MATALFDSGTGRGPNLASLAACTAAIDRKQNSNIDTARQARFNSNFIAEIIAAKTLEAMLLALVKNELYEIW